MGARVSSHVSRWIGSSRKKRGTIPRSLSWIPSPRATSRRRATSRLQHAVQRRRRAFRSAPRRGRRYGPKIGRRGTFHSKSLSSRRRRRPRRRRAPPPWQRLLSRVPRRLRPSLPSGLRIAIQSTHSTRATALTTSLSAPRTSWRMQRASRRRVHPASATTRSSSTRRWALERRISSTPWVIAFAKIGLRRACSFSRRSASPTSSSRRFSIAASMNFARAIATTATC